MFDTCRNYLIFSENVVHAVIFLHLDFFLEEKQIKLFSTLCSISNPSIITWNDFSIFLVILYNNRKDPLDQKSTGAENKLCWIKKMQHLHHCCDVWCRRSRQKKNEISDSYPNPFHWFLSQKASWVIGLHNLWFYFE